MAESTLAVKLLNKRGSVLYIYAIFSTLTNVTIGKVPTIIGNRLFDCRVFLCKKFFCYSFNPNRSHNSGLLLIRFISSLMIACASALTCS